MPSSGASRHLLPHSPSRDGRSSERPNAGEGIHPRHTSMAEHIRATHAVRLGLRQIVGVKEDDMRRLVERRGEGYDSVRDLWLRSGLSPAALERLADADAFRSLGLDRREALWAVRGLDRVGDKDDAAAVRRLAARTRRGARRKTAADAARRACGRGLPAPVSVAESPSDLVHARAAFRRAGFCAPTRSPRSKAASA